MYPSLRVCLRASRSAAALALLLLAGCAAAREDASVRVGGHRFEVEVVSDEAAKERGLMFRESLPADHGMLFVYDQAGPRAFWMRNCRIPLDIMFFDADARFVSAQYRVPTCLGDPCPTYPSTGPARYVLELNAGVGEALSLRAGAPLTLPGH
jgi:uncharacterized membrane protein (UPF0127 family)